MWLLCEISQGAERRQEKKSDGRKVALHWGLERLVSEWMSRWRTGIAEHTAQLQQNVESGRNRAEKETGLQDPWGRVLSGFSLTRPSFFLRSTAIICEWTHLFGRSESNDPKHRRGGKKMLPKTAAQSNCERQIETRKTVPKDWAMLSWESRACFLPFSAGLHISQSTLWHWARTVACCTCTPRTKCNEQDKEI